MILAAHQPGYFPQPFVFQKMRLADVFIIADDIQYSTRSNLNRARIKTVAGAEWLTVPVFTRGRLGQLINQVRIADAYAWQQKHLRAIEVNYRKAAYFEKYLDGLEGLYRRHWNRLLDLNVATMDFIREALGISTPVQFSSALNCRAAGTQKIIELAQRLNCTTYLVEREAARFLEEDLFHQHGISLCYINAHLPPYHQQFSGWLPGLSILDLLLNEGDEARAILSNLTVSKTEPAAKSLNS